MSSKYFLKYFLYGALFGPIPLLLLAGTLVWQPKDLCFTKDRSLSCAKTASGEAGSPRQEIASPYGSLELVYAGNDLALAGNLKRPTACTEWRAETVNDPADPQSVIISLTSEDKSDVCLENLIPPQTVYHSDIGNPPGTVYTIIMNGDILYSGNLTDTYLKWSNDNNLI